MFCSCDYDQPDFINTEIRKAKKEHKCCECGYTIKPGEQYEYVFGLWNVKPDTYKTCERCLDLRENLLQIFGCYYYTQLFDQYREYLSMQFFEDIGDQVDKIKNKHKKAAMF